MTGQTCHMLTSQQFDFYWPAIEKELDTVKHTWDIWWTKDSIREAVLDQRLQCWAIGGLEAVHLVAFTNIVHYPANTIFRIVLLLGNNLDEYYDTTEAVLEKFAMDRGCSHIECCGRKGWAKRIKDAKYHGVVLTRQLSTLRVQ